MPHQARRLVLLICLLIAPGCEAVRTLVGIFSLDSQDRAVDRATKGSPNENIQFERSQSHQQLDHRFDSLGIKPGGPYGAE